VYLGIVHLSFWYCAFVPHCSIKGPIFQVISRAVVSQTTVAAFAKCRSMIVPRYHVTTMDSVLMESPPSYATVQVHSQGRGVRGGLENVCSNRAKIMEHALKELVHRHIPVYAQSRSLVKTVNHAHKGFAILILAKTMEHVEKMTQIINAVVYMALWDGTVI